MCLVTGATGLVGRHLLPQLLERWQVVAIARSPDSQVAHPALSWLRGDLTDATLVNRLPARCDAVVHLAQSPRFRDFPAGVADVLAVNIGSTEWLARYAVQHGVRHFVYTSSGGVYAPSAAPLCESSPLAAPSTAGWYQASKIAAEALVQAYRDHFVPVVLRPFFVYGAHQQRHMLLPRLCDAVRDGRPVPLAGPHGLRLSLTHVDDVAAAIVQALTLATADTINVAGPDILSLREICEILAAHLGVSPHFDSTHGEPTPLVADRTHQSATLGIATRRFVDHVTSVLS